jgi:hypothetical protein
MLHTTLQYMPLLLLTAAAAAAPLLLLIAILSLPAVAWA